MLDDPAAAELLRAARADDDPFVRLAVELLARTGLRKGVLLGLTVDAVVQIGSAFCSGSHGKLHNDRYIPSPPQLKELLDQWLGWQRGRGICAPTSCSSSGGDRSPSRASVDAAVAKVARSAEILRAWGTSSSATFDEQKARLR